MPSAPLAARSNRGEPGAPVKAPLIVISFDVPVMAGFMASLAVIVAVVGGFPTV